MRAIHVASPSVSQPAPALGRARGPLLVAVALAVVAGAAAADDRVKTDGLWRGSAGAALSATSGNTRSTAVLLNADVARLTSADKIAFGGNIQYARSEAGGVDKTTADQVGAFGQYDFNLSPRLFAFGRLALDRDSLIDLNLRTALNGGLGFKVLDRNGLRWRVFGGAGVTQDRYDTAKTIGGETDLRFRRTTLLLAEESEHALGASTSLKQRLEWLPSVGGDKGQRLNLRADMAVAIDRTMSLTVGLTARHDSEPPAGTKSTDTGLFTGINVKLGAP